MKGLLVLEVMAAVLVFSFGCGAEKKPDEEIQTCADSACMDGDNCCPRDCTSLNDSDCKSVCGNGVVEAGETCDGACPTICGDVDECTQDLIVGDPELCTAECIHEPIVDCMDDDGCCAPSCNSLNDDDCLPVCGNGLLEEGESCDGDCPQECDDSDMCTTDSMSGHADTCDVKCVHAQVVECIDGDACCAPGCNALTDRDCEPVCGNEVLEPGETCDPAQDCPSENQDCDDGDSCTEDTIEGSFDACNSECMHRPIERCFDDDGCCPQWCNSLSDSDCEPVCGNGLLEEGENCDPPESCPQSGQDCDDGDPCTEGMVYGSVENCTAKCGSRAVTSNIDGDSCCPAGYDALSDGDCAGCTDGSHPCDDGCCDFSSQGVEGTMGSGQYTDVAIDSNGQIHVAYTVPGWTVRHAVSSGGGWIKEDISPELQTGLFPSMALDSQGNPTVAYYQPSSNSLMVATRDGDRFEAEAICDMGNIHANTRPLDLIINGHGNPLVLFFDESSKQIMLAARGDQWFIWPGPAAQRLLQLRAVLGEDGRIHMVWSELESDEYESGSVYYAVYESGHWSRERIGSFVATGGVDLALDSQGQARVVYSWSSRMFLYREHSTSGWEDIEEIPLPLSCDWFSLALGPENTLHLALHDTEDDSLLYARKTLGHWSFMLPASSNHAGLRPAIVLDDEKQPVIVHGATGAGVGITYW